MEGCSPPAAEQPQETTVSGRGGVPSEGAGEEFLPQPVWFQPGAGWASQPIGGVRRWLGGGIGSLSANRRWGWAQTLSSD